MNDEVADCVLALIEKDPHQFGTRKWREKSNKEPVK